MTFNLKEFLAKITGLEARAEAAFKGELVELKSIASGIQNELTAAHSTIAGLNTENAILKTEVDRLSDKFSTVSRTLADATTILRAHLAMLPGQEDFKDGGSKAGATLAELIAAEQNATNTAMAATGIKANMLPSGSGGGFTGGRPPNLTQACLSANRRNES